MTQEKESPLQARSKRVHEQVVARIRKLIDEGELAPGDRLPPERELAKTFAVSRNSVREALGALREKGHVESRLGAGTYVTDAAVVNESLVESLAESMGKGRQKLHEVFELRRILEPGIAALAADNASNDDLQALHDLLSAQTNAVSNDLDASELDASFHALLASASGNSVIMDMFVHLQEIINESRDPGVQSSSRQEQSLIAHQRIVNAIAARDGQKASQCMAEHLQSIENIVLE